LLQVRFVFFAMIVFSPNTGKETHDLKQNRGPNLIPLFQNQMEKTKERQIEIFWSAQLSNPISKGAL
jgi:hypothetical protein